MNEQLPLVILPKTSFSEKTRAPLGPLLQDAGYTRAATAQEDDTEEGGFLFRRVKGARALAWQMEQAGEKPIAIIMGTDVLGEATLLAEQNNVRAEINRLLTLGLGPCRLAFLAQKVCAITEWTDLKNKTIITKFPLLLRRLLYQALINRLLSNKDAITIREMEGADRRLWESKDNPDMAAFDIVQSGRSAEQNGQQVADEIEYPSVDFVDFRRIQTDLFLTNIQGISDRTRQAFQEFGLALESARQCNQSVFLDFNVEEQWKDRFVGLGMIGPTIGNVLASGDTKYIALRIAVPESKKNWMRRELIRRGARDIVCSGPCSAEGDPTQSEVLRVLPFTEREQSEVNGGPALSSPNAEQRDDRQAEQSPLSIACMGAAPVGARH